MVYTTTKGKPLSTVKPFYKAKPPISFYRYKIKDKELYNQMLAAYKPFRSGKG